MPDKSCPHRNKFFRDTRIREGPFSNTSKRGTRRKGKRREVRPRFFRPVDPRPVDTVLSATFLSVFRPLKRDCTLAHPLSWLFLRSCLCRPRHAREFNSVLEPGRQCGLLASEVTSALPRRFGFYFSLLSLYSIRRRSERDTRDIAVPTTRDSKRNLFESETCERRVHFKRAKFIFQLCAVHIVRNAFTPDVHIT